MNWHVWKDLFLNICVIWSVNQIILFNGFLYDFVEITSWVNTGVFFAWAYATVEQAMCMEAHHRVCLHQNGVSQSYHPDYFACWSWRMCSWFNKMCSLQKKSNMFLTKRSRQVLTYMSYYQVLSPHLTWTTVRIYAVPVGLRWPHQSLNKVPKRLLMQVNTFNFLCFEMGKEQKYQKKKSKFWINICSTILPALPLRNNSWNS